jgi:hypothetical protein
LKNLCYAAAVFQCVTSQEDFCAAVVKESTSSPIGNALKNAIIAREECSLEEFQSQLIKLRRRFAVGPYSHFREVKDQQCSEEYFSSLLSALHGQLVFGLEIKGQQANETLVTRFYGGKLLERYSCSW